MMYFLDKSYSHLEVGPQCCETCIALLAQDPTEQTAIDNFMVQQLDGTVNEWGWCKQKVIYQNDFVQFDILIIDDRHN